MAWPLLSAPSERGWKTGDTISLTSASSSCSGLAMLREARAKARRPAAALLQPHRLIRSLQELAGPEKHFFDV